MHTLTQFAAVESCYHKQTATEKEKKKTNEQVKKNNNDNKKENVLCTWKKNATRVFAKPFSIISGAKTVKTLSGRASCS